MCVEIKTPAKILGIAAIAAIAAVSMVRLHAAPSPGARIGEPAPPFSAPDIDGKTVGLGDYAGKTIVLEWTNAGCPFVGKHDNSGNMQSLQQKYVAQGIVWLTIASSAPGEQGYVTPQKAKADLAHWHAAPTDYLLDPDGTIGHLYDARATPDMVVIDPAGRVAYMLSLIHI